ncbi:MAG: hypothetical protein N4A33_08340 [Bacteriovoracaceae bacterium]|jgi:hypothetical protein|nr:hypothetical protein [Bacteriovoracaceae bacterium]
MTKSVLLLLTLICISCGESSSGSKNSLGLAGSIFKKASDAVQSGAGAISSKSITYNRSSNCDGMVSDITSDSTGAGEYLGCILSTNSKSPDTVKGAFHIITEVMKMLEGSIDFTYDSSYTSHEGLSGTVNMSEGTQTVTVSIKERSLSSNWDYEIQLCILNLNGTTMNANLAACESTGFTFSVFLKDSDNKLGFKSIERFGSFSGGTTFLLDNSSEELRYEGWDLTNDRHTRIYMQGTVSTDYQLDSVNSITVAVSDPGMTGSGTDALYGEFDGTNLCVTGYDTGTPSSHNLQVQGTCLSYPTYNAGFATEDSSGVETFLNDTTKGILAFNTASFSISSFFIDI